MTGIPQAREVDITGTGGVGKTRLALRAAADAAEDHATAPFTDQAVAGLAYSALRRALALSAGAVRGPPPSP
jgi:predicted ATPase